MFKRVTSNTAVAEQTDKFNFWEYYSKRDNLSVLINARNEGNEKASDLVEHIFESFSKSGNRNAGIAATLLNRCHRYAYVLYTDSQLNGLAVMATELGYSIPKCPIWHQEDSTQRPTDESTFANQDLDVVEKAVPAEESPKWTPDPNGVRMFDIVEFADTKTDDTRIMQIVGEGKSDTDKNLLAINTPIASAMIGHLPGDEVSVVTPKGIRTIKINDIAR